MKPIDHTQAQRRFAKAISFTENVVGDHDRASEIRADGLSAWLEKKGYTLSNPPRRGVNIMARRTETDKLQDAIDDAYDALSDAYTPEASREQLASAIGDILEQLEEHATDDVSDDAEGEGDDDQD